MFFFSCCFQSRDARSLCTRETNETRSLVGRGFRSNKRTEKECQSKKKETDEGPFFFCFFFCTTGDGGERNEISQCRMQNLTPFLSFFSLSRQEDPAVVLYQSLFSSLSRQTREQEKNRRVSEAARHEQEQREKKQDGSDFFLRFSPDCFSHCLFSQLCLPTTPATKREREKKNDARAGRPHH